jgi:uncharacterized protein
MHPAIPQVLELQRLDQQIAVLRAELETLPKKMREADAKLTGARSALASAKETQTQGQTQRRKLEGDVEQWKERARKYRAQSSSVKTNEAYKALQHEIANAEGEASRSEDLVLEQMMALEEAERRVKRTEAELKEAEQALVTEKKHIETQYGEKKKSAEAAAAERAQIAGKIPEDILDLYTRIMRKHPGTVMAEVREGQCRSCGLRVLPHTVQLLTTDVDEELFRCESCGRILYSLEPIPHASPPAPASGAAHS